MSISTIGLFEAFFKPFEARAMRTSLQEREALGKGADSSLTYGEMPIASLEQILLFIEVGPRDYILDMGSGAGKLVLGALYLYPNLRVAGVEILPALHELALEIFDEFQRQLLSKAFGEKQVSFILGDMMEVDLKEYTILFINGTCHSEEQLAQIGRHLVEKARPGAKIVSLGRALKAVEGELELLKAGAWRMGWQTLGMRTPVFIYRVKNKRLAV